MDSRRQRLERSRLYLVCGSEPDAFLDMVLRAGVDLVQLRMKHAGDEAILQTARRFRRVCSRHGALLILNDRPDLVGAAGADGVHLGQEDGPVREAREAVGDDHLVGLSTHNPEQIESAAGVDYIGVGPVFETPTKPGRPAVGLELVTYAAARARLPFFAIGGITPANVAEVHQAGAERVAVVRALTESAAPARAARQLSQALSGGQTEGARVGAA